MEAAHVLERPAWVGRAVGSTRLAAFALFAAFAMLTGLSAGPGVPALTETTRAATQEGGLDAYRQLPLAFVENRGQLDNASVRFYAQTADMAVGFGREGVLLTLAKRADGHEGVMLGLRFVGANPAPAIRGGGRERGVVNYMVGQDASRWQTGLPTYSAVGYEAVWPGIDARFTSANGALKYEFVVQPGANVSDIGLRYAGAQNLSVASTGALLVQTPVGTLRDARPKAFQQIGGRTVPVASSYALAGGTRYGFTVGAYDKRYPLVVDPGIRYSTFLGGSLNDEAFGIEVGGRDVYVTGATQSLDFPTTPGVLDNTENGSDDVFVTKFDNEGEELIYSTYLGGTLSDVGESVAVDGSGHAYVTGETESLNFPTTLGVVQPALRGTEDAFVAKLDANGTRLVYSTYLGGTLLDQGRGIEVQAGHAYVAGVTFSMDYPVTPDSFDSSFNGVTEAFVTKLDTNGDRIANSTYLGGLLDDVGRGITLRGGYAYVTGYTESPNFPTESPVQPTNRGARDAFATKFDTDGMRVIFSTYLGGTSFDEGFGIEADGQGNAYITGDTFSPDFPVTPGSWDETYNLNGDAFVTKLDESGAALVYSTYLGGVASDSARGISVDGSGNATAGNAYVAGSTNSPDFDVTPGAFQPAYGGGTSDAFLTEFTVDGAALLYSTYLGGQNRDTSRSVSVRDGDPYMTGFTTSATFPTTPGAWDNGWNGNRDAFVTAFDLRSG